MFLVIINFDLESAMQLLIAATVLLTAATLLLFTITVALRLKQNRENKKMNEYRDLYLPLIFDFLEDNVHTETFKNLLGSNELKFRTFENTIVRLLKNVGGDEAEKLKRLLMIDPLFKFHLKQLRSNSDVVQIEACNYFRYTNLIKGEVIFIIKEFLQSENTYLAFSAASAMMASNSLNDRINAMESFAKREGISKMALLELFYRFKQNHKSQTPKEAAFLEKLIADLGFTSKQRALLIQSVSESNYYLMIEPLKNWLNSTEDQWKEPEVLSALIDAQRIFLNSEAAETIKKYLDFPDQHVRKIAHKAMMVLDQHFIHEKAIA